MKMSEYGEKRRKETNKNIQTHKLNNKINKTIMNLKKKEIK